jgi:hypothetical protein
VIDSAWFEARRPRAPAGLGQAMAQAVGAARTEKSEGGPSGTGSIRPTDECALGPAAGDLLKAAGAALGPDRNSAFSLLAADGLLTYACEVALDSGDPVMAMRRLLTDASSS